MQPSAGAAPDHCPTASGVRSFRAQLPITAYQPDHRVAAIGEQADQFGAEQAGGAGDEDA